jgi:hypothetical protein
MVRRLLILVFGLTLLVSGAAVAAPVQASGEIVDKGSYDDTYRFKDRGCAFPFIVKGRRFGYSVLRLVPGSDGQAFLLDDEYAFREILRNPANGKWMKVWGIGHVREISARHVEGDIWRFIAIETGTPFVVENAAGRIILRDHGTIRHRTLFDTLGDSQPGGEVLEHHTTVVEGSFPSLKRDFCSVVERLIG